MNRMICANSIMAQSHCLYQFKVVGDSKELFQ